MRRLYQHAALPPAKQAAGRSCFHGRLSVILFRDGVEIPDPMSFLGGTHPPGYMGHGILKDTVDMRAVRTLLECFLVLFICCFLLLTVEDLDNPGNVYAPYSSTCSPLSYITLLAQLFAKHNLSC